MTFLILLFVAVWVAACVIVVAVCRAAGLGEARTRLHAGGAASKVTADTVDDETFESPLAF